MMDELPDGEQGLLVEFDFLLARSSPEDALTIKNIVFGMQNPTFANAVIDRVKSEEERMTFSSIEKIAEKLVRFEGSEKFGQESPLIDWLNQSNIENKITSDQARIGIRVDKALRRSQYYKDAQRLSTLFRVILKNETVGDFRTEIVKLRLPYPYQFGPESFQVLKGAIQIALKSN